MDASPPRARGANSTTRASPPACSTVTASGLAAAASSAFHALESRVHAVRDRASTNVLTRIGWCAMAAEYVGDGHGTSAGLTPLRPFEHQPHAAWALLAPWFR